MNLSNTLLNNLSNKLNIDTSLLKEEKNYMTSLSELIVSLSDLEHNTKFKSIWKYQSTNEKKFILEQDFVIVYIITITFLKANTMIHISDTTGNIKWFCSSGLVSITGKRKKKRRSVLLKLIILLLKKASFLSKNPVALHLNNVSSYQTFIVDRLKQNIFIKIIKSFNQTPYNGCRKKKIRRKKYSKVFT
jgi:ribosomal protein S11